MTDPRARFHFVAEADGARNTVVAVKTIQVEGEDIAYSFPLGFQTKVQHPKLFETTVVKGVVKSLNARGKYRNVVVTLKEDLKGHYLDEEGNVCYEGYYLDEVRVNTDSTPRPSQVPNSDSQAEVSERIKNMVLDKFSNKNQNATIFMEQFLDECKKLNLREEHFAETLKYFLEGSAIDWFQSFLKANKITRPWEFWKNSFIDTFAVISWSEIKYAYDFRHIEGPLLDYALKKRNLLLSADSELTVNTQINFIVLGLPTQIRSHLKKKDLSSIESLMSCVQQLEGFLPKKNVKMVKSVDYVSEKSERKPCSYCIKKGFPNRVHTEEVCRLKIADRNKNRNDKIKVINNTNIQECISSSDESKNE